MLQLIAFSLARFVARPCILLPGHWIQASTASRREQIALPELPQRRRKMFQCAGHSPGDRDDLIRSLCIVVIRHTAMVPHTCASHEVRGVSRLTDTARLSKHSFHGLGYLILFNDSHA